MVVPLPETPFLESDDGIAMRTGKLGDRVGDLTPRKRNAWKERLDRSPFISKKEPGSYGVIADCPALSPYQAQSHLGREKHVVINALTVAWRSFRSAWEKKKYSRDEMTPPIP